VVLRPVGRLSPRVYWFRRLLVLLVVVVVLWAGYRWLGPSADPAVPDTAAATPTATPTVTATSPSPSPAETSAGPTESPTRTATPGAPDCRDRDLSLTVSTDAESYAEGVQPEFTLTVANESEATCVRDLGQQALELRVSSGGVRIWSSDDCNPDGPSDPTRLRPGDPFVQSVSWSRLASQPGCPADEPAADPGQYQVIARNLDLLSEPAVFTLE
jgi:hypothetical protein